MNVNPFRGKKEPTTDAAKFPVQMVNSTPLVRGFLFYSPPYLLSPFYYIMRYNTDTNILASNGKTRKSTDYFLRLYVALSARYTASFDTFMSRAHQRLQRPEY